jgi:hypothetical protein
MVWKDVG